MKNYAYSLASSAIGAITVTLIMGLLAEFLLGWQWWIYMVIAFSWIGFVGAILRFLILEGKKCPQCGDNIGRDSKFCKNCRYQFYKECPKCGELLRSGARFCDKCGAQIE